MDKSKIRSFFWKVASYIEDCSSSSIEDLRSGREEIGISLSENCFITACSDEELIKLYDGECQHLLTITKDCETLLALKGLFDDLEADDDI